MSICPTCGSRSHASPAPAGSAPASRPPWNRLVQAVAHGPWKPAVRTAAIALGAVIVPVAIAVYAVASAVHVHLEPLLPLRLAATLLVLAFRGSAEVSAELYVSFFGGSGGGRFTVPLLGLAAIAAIPLWFAGRRLRKVSGVAERIGESARTALALGALVLLAGLFASFHVVETSEEGGIDLNVRVNSITAALGALALGLLVMAWSSGAITDWLRRSRAAWLEGACSGAVAAAGIGSVMLAAVVVVSAIAAVDGPPQAKLGVIAGSMLVFPNLLIEAIALGMGSSVTTSAGDALTLAQVWDHYPLAALALLAMTAVVAVTIGVGFASGQGPIAPSERARRAARLAGAYAALWVLLTVITTSSVGSAGGDFGGSFGLDLFRTALVAALWGFGGALAGFGVLDRIERVPAPIRAVWCRLGVLPGALPTDTVSTPAADGPAESADWVMAALLGLADRAGTPLSQTDINLLLADAPNARRNAQATTLAIRRLSPLVASAIRREPGWPPHVATIARSDEFPVLRRLLLVSMQSQVAAG